MLFSRTRGAFGVVLLCFSFPAFAADAPPSPSASQSYTFHNVAMGGGGFVDGLVFHPTAPDLLYARTDVGGAYRWDASTQTWIPLLDWLGPDQANFTGIESIGLDPRHPDRVFLAAGTYRFGEA